MTLFKVSTIELNTFTVSFLYFCTPLTYSLNEVILEITVPGCGKTILSWMKKCGDSLSRFNLIKHLTQDYRLS